jgi:DNA invertase Pin-like site-specific DNA recombinase
MARKLIPYMRKSSKDDPVISLDRQRRAIVGWAKSNKVALAGEVVESGVSGSKLWRDRELGKAIDACERGEAAGIIVEEQDRLSRENGLATAEVWEALGQANARLVCVADGIDTATGDHEMLFTIKAAINRDRWKQYARRAEASKRTAVVEQGLHIGPTPVGYLRPRAGVRLAKDPAKWKAIRSAFELRAAGAGYGDVARLLDKRLPGGPSGNGGWNRNTVTRLLKNRVYLGEARGGDGHVHPDAHRPVVDQATFNTVQALAGRPERSAPNSRARSLLAGVVFCGGCGYALDRNKVGGRYLVYRCRAHTASGACAAPTSVMMDKLDEFVSGRVVERLSGHAVEQVPATVDVEGIHARLDAARRKREPFEDPEYVAALGRDAALRALRKVDDEISVLEDELAEAVGTNRAAGSLVVLPTVDVWETLTTDEQRTVITAMVDGVIVSRGLQRRVPLTGRVRIVWNGDGEPVSRHSRGRRANRAELEPRRAAA